MKRFSIVLVMLALVLLFGLALVTCEFSGSAGGGSSGDTYTVTFHYGEGGGVPPNAIRVPVGFPDIVLPGQGNMTHPTKAFSGWNSSGGFYGPNTTYRVTKDVDFTAIWTDGTPGNPGGTNTGGTNTGGTNTGGTNTGGTDNSNASIVGTWRTDNGDSTFIFNCNLTFSLTMSSNEGSGTYSVSGSVITIIMNRETYTGSLNGNTLIFFGRSYTKTSQGTNPPAATNPFLGTWNGNHPEDKSPVRLVFTSNMVVTFTDVNSGADTVGTYTYSGNTATLNFGGEIVVAVVSGNVLTFTQSGALNVILTR
jgi:hypothetical protein